MKLLPWLANPQVGRKGPLILTSLKHTAKNLMRRLTKKNTPRLFEVKD